MLTFSLSLKNVIIFETHSNSSLKLHNALRSLMCHNVADVIKTFEAAYGVKYL